MTDLFERQLVGNKYRAICGGFIPKHPSMRIIGFKNAVHNSPIDIGAYAIEGNIHTLSDLTPSTITTDQELSSDLLFFSCLFIGQIYLYWIFSFILNHKIFDGCQAFNEFLVPIQIPNKDPFDLALSDDVKSSVAGVGLVRTSGKNFRSIPIYGSALNQWPFFVDLLSKTPLVKSFQETGLDTIGTPSKQGPWGFVYVILVVTFFLERLS